MNWYIAVLKKYAVFDGRAQRQEYWIYLLVSVVISIVLSFIDGMTGMMNTRGQGLFVSIYGLAVLVPSIAVAARRLHDTRRSGWWLLVAFVPLIGTIILLVFFVQDGDPNDNQYGPNPKTHSA